MSLETFGLQTLSKCRELNWAGFETGISRPVPAVAEGRVRLWYFLYRSSFRPPKQIIHPPTAQIAADYATGEIVEHKPLAIAADAEVLGEYPHAAAENVPIEQWDAVWDELFALYPEIIEGFAGHSITDLPQKASRFLELFGLTEPPFLLTFYEALNPAFFAWLQRVSCGTHE